MARADGLRWVWRITAAAVFGLVVLMVSPIEADGVAIEQPVRAYPRCTSDGGINGWVWYAGDESLGVTRQDVIEVGGRRHGAPDVDCVAAVACLADRPEFSGRFATIVGTPGDDRLIGTPGRDVIVGRSGDDELRGRSGADLLCGGPGDDLVRAGRGDDVVDGGGGGDRVFGGGGDDDLSGGAGRDAVYGQAGADRVDGAGGTDSCFGGGAEDLLVACEVEVGTAARYGSGRVRDFVVIVEDDLAVARVDVVTEVDRILADGRSWIADGKTGFRRTVDDADFTIIVASPATVDDLCAPLGTGGYLSCRNGSRVILNVNRWVGATDWWTAGIDTYREYLVNHEVGHLLGHGHVGCPGEGSVAPVMMQQTKGLGACVANGWPFAEAATG